MHVIYWGESDREQRDDGVGNISQHLRTCTYTRVSQPCSKPLYARVYMRDCVPPRIERIEPYLALDGFYREEGPHTA